jgi:hypothetical protein
MNDISLFISSYSEAVLPRICFAWNGKHATEFEDANQGYRWQVVDQCLKAPQTASPLLLEHLFLADAEWTAEAWGAPGHFAQLGSLLLERGQERAVGVFAEGFVRSFDTFGACHELNLPAELVGRLRRAADAAVLRESDEESRKALEAARVLFEKLEAGTSADGWVAVAPGTPVSNIRVVSPAWHFRAWTKFTTFWKRGKE